MPKPPRTRFPDTRLLVFTKAPLPGQVKSRLVPDIGEQAAAQLQRLMTLNTVSMAVNSGICPVELWCSPDPSHELFRDLASRFSLVLRSQQGADLGERMLHAARSALQQANSIIIIGSDCLQITEEHLQAAAISLSSGDYDSVVGPAHDGGYVLIGMNGVEESLFRNIDWGSGDVMGQTLRALALLQWRWMELPVLRDIDVKSDLLDIRARRNQYRPDAGIDLLLQEIIGAWRVQDSAK